MRSSKTPVSKAFKNLSVEELTTQSLDVTRRSHQAAEIGSLPERAHLEVHMQTYWQQSLYINILKPHPQIAA
jgi:hypothetical protein